jgi:ribonuclease HI
MRDGKGAFLAALSKQVSIDVTPVVAETIAALHAVMWCIEQGFKRVVFEGDSLQVVNEVNSIHPCDSLYGHLIEDIKTGIQTLDVAIFSHVEREANGAAHELAVDARTHVTDTIRWTTIPPSICGIVRREEVSPSL